MPQKVQEPRKEVVQSYLITSANYNFSVYEKRILYRIVELIQKEIQGIPLSSGIKIQPTLFKEREITMPLSKFLLRGETDKHHRSIRQAFQTLTSSSISKITDRKYIFFSVVSWAEIDRYTRSVKFKINNELYSELLDFAKGYSEYELKSAFSFHSQYTMRLYELTAKQRDPISYSIGRLREIFCLEKKYRDNSAFVKRVIDPAQRELEASTAPSFFTYKVIRTGRSITEILFTNHNRNAEKKPLVVPLPETAEEKERLEHLLSYLSKHLGVNSSAFLPHQRLLLDNLRLSKRYRRENELDHIIKGSESAANRVGYVINALKNRIKNP